MTEDDPEARLAAWPERERYWRTALGRLRLGVEPIPEQVERYRRSTMVLIGITLGIGAMFVALFSAFSKPVHGLVVGGVIAVPIALSAWFGFVRLRRRALQYLQECEEIERLRGQGEQGTVAR